VELLYEEVNRQDAPTLVALLQETALFLWKEWSHDMQAALLDPQTRRFTLRGVCPHCTRNSVFVLVTSTCLESIGTVEERWIAGMRCQGCFEYILGIVLWNPYGGNLRYETHYPLGKPDDDVAQEIPEHIQPDFKEALRCLFVDAYNATAEMCRRAIEASCLDLGAPKKDVLEDMIDWLADQRIITPLLQQAAHKVRLGGNRGAHPPVDGAVVPATPKPKNAPIEKIEKDHALAIVAFTGHFFEHVYVIPKQLDKYDFSKPKAVKKP
jgi:hypothetical protein